MDMKQAPLGRVGCLLYVQVAFVPVGAGLVVKGQAWALPVQMVTRPAGE